MSSIIEVKAEAKKLIKQYKELQAEAKTAKTAEEAAHKITEAEKLASQISALKIPITKIKAKELATQTTKTRHEVAKTSVLERIHHLEDAQKKTRIQIEQLNRAKAEIGHLKRQAEKSIASVTQERQPNNEKLQRELARLIKKKEAEQLAVKQELDTIHKQAKKEAELLKMQRDAARALIQKHEEEKEQSIALHSTNKKDLLIGIGIGTILSLILCKCGNFG